MSEKRMKLIRESLEKLRPSSVDIEDEGHLHIGHAGAKSGGHFKLNIVSESFKDKSTIERHRIIYKCLSDLMNTEIHAISIKAKSKDEA
jgi:BolA protein